MNQLIPGPQQMNGITDKPLLETNAITVIDSSPGGMIHGFDWHMGVT